MNSASSSEVMSNIAATIGTWSTQVPEGKHNVHRPGKTANCKSSVHEQCLGPALRKVRCLPSGLHSPRLQPACLVVVSCPPLSPLRLRLDLFVVRNDGTQTYPSVTGANEISLPCGSIKEILCLFDNETVVAYITSKLLGSHLS